MKAEVQWQLHVRVVNTNSSSESLSHAGQLYFVTTEIMDVKIAVASLLVYAVVIAAKSAEGVYQSLKISNSNYSYSIAVKNNREIPGIREIKVIYVGILKNQFSIVFPYRNA
jgi:hypothetical protein